MAQLPSTANGSLWIAPALKSGGVGEMTALNAAAGADGFAFS